MDAALPKTLRAGLISLAVGTLLLGVKFAAWIATGSTALLADALESIVNVVAAAIASYTVGVAARPPDADHPYGHGKAEFVSAAIEGALIVVAATSIVTEAIRELLSGPELQRFGTGIALAGAAGVANTALGLYLLRVSRETQSAALDADGRHILTDVVTTGASIFALGAVWLTGLAWLDPIIALAVAANIVRVGWKVVRNAMAGLLDEADFDLLDRAAEVLERAREEDWIDVHQLRTWKSGDLHHIDLHVAVPRFYSIEEGHAVAEGIEQALLELVGGRGDVVIHVDPCTPDRCSGCAMSACEIRSAPCEARAPFRPRRVTRMGDV